MGEAVYQQFLRTSRSVAFGIIAGLIFTFVTGLGPDVCPAQTLTSAKVRSTPQPETIQIEGVVSQLKKYSFTVAQGDKEFQLKLAPNAPVALRMNQPWFDWDNKRVVVDGKLPASETKSVGSNAGSKEAPRVPFKLPSEELYLIARFDNVEHMKWMMDQKPVRLNFYLLTPFDPGENYPTEDKPHLSGKLKYGKTNGPVFIEIDDQKIPVILGFRSATMNGLSMTDFKANKTQVTLSGVQNDNGQIEANRVLFFPIEPSAQK